MELEWVLTNLLLATAVTLAIGICLPDVLFLLGLTRIKRGVLGGPNDVECGPADIPTREVVEQLAELGFKPVGLYWEQLPAHKMFRETIFASGTRDCFAAVYRLFGNEPPRVAFKTSFGDGAYVLTQNYAGGMSAVEETLWAGGLEKVPLRDVLAEHRMRMQHFVQAGHIALPAATLEDHIETEEAYMAHPIVRQSYRGTVAKLFSVKFTFLAGIPWLLIRSGVSLDVVGALLLAQCLSMLLFRYYGATLENRLPAEASD